ncbi:MULTISPECIES: DUF1918 domain-containing protein [unclassified Streptomyces]|uniref:DUF1918 domain-containing protein n=1 Tax=unclassified Streptomyces TaxID=2593676 RepID=UPI0035D88CE8
MRAHPGDQLVAESPATGTNRHDGRIVGLPHEDGRPPCDGHPGHAHGPPQAARRHEGLAPERGVPDRLRADLRRHRHPAAPTHRSSPTRSSRTTARSRIVVPQQSSSTHPFASLSSASRRLTRPTSSYGSRPHRRGPGP